MPVPRAFGTHNWQDKQALIVITGGMPRSHPVDHTYRHTNLRRAEHVPELLNHTWRSATMRVDLLSG